MTPRSASVALATCRCETSSAREQRCSDGVGLRCGFWECCVRTQSLFSSSRKRKVVRLVQEIIGPSSATRHTAALGSTVERKRKGQFLNHFAIHPRMAAMRSTPTRILKPTPIFLQHCLGFSAQRSGVRGAPREVNKKMQQERRDNAVPPAAARKSEAPRAAPKAPAQAKPR